MKLRFKVCTSTEITEQEWIFITDGFNESFERDLTVEQLKKYYCTNYKGYSYHVLTFSEETGDFLGSTSVYPYQYVTKNGSEIFTGLSGGSFILKKARTNPLLYRETYTALRKYCIGLGMKFIIGIPNQNLFLYSTKAMPFKFVFDLPYYILPVNIGAIKRSLSSFNILYRIFLKMYLGIQALWYSTSNHEEESSNLSLLLNDEFYANRFANNYKRFEAGEVFGYYKIYQEKGLNTAYIFDFRNSGKRDARSLNKIVRHIISVEKVDAILFVGTLRLKQLSLLKVPEKKIPKRLPFTIDILAKDEIPGLLETNTWNFSLMNFDGR